MTAAVLQMDGRIEDTSRHPQSGSSETSVPHSLLSASLLAMADIPDSPGSKSVAFNAIMFPLFLGTPMGKVHRSSCLRDPLPPQWTGPPHQPANFQERPSVHQLMVPPVLDRHPVPTAPS
mmetsp:Transcript_47793/g.126510  ORF Transcript_47793/g.126510 Transcript_47793/m.126510 type:complete len:120 (-) Transcript_47793:1303-1662(-)